jgi:hypothetical protein
MLDTHKKPQTHAMEWSKFGSELKLNLNRLNWREPVLLQLEKH